MAFMRPTPFKNLSPGDMFKTKGVECIVLDHPSESEVRNNGSVFNAVSLDGKAKLLFDGDELVDVTRFRVHILDLRQGDQITLDRSIGLAYNVSTVLKVWEEKGYRHVKIARCMICASGFGTTCPSAQIHIEQYDVMCRLGDTKRNEYYYVVGVDSGALYDSHSFTFTSDQFRMAVYLRANGDKREMAEILSASYCSVREQVTGIIYDRIKHREEVPEFPDRNDGEKIYEKNLRERGERDNDLTKAEVKYLALCDLRKSH